MCVCVRSLCTCAHIMCHLFLFSGDSVAIAKLACRQSPDCVCLTVRRPVHPSGAPGIYLCQWSGSSCHPRLTSGMFPESLWQVDLWKVHLSPPGLLSVHCTRQLNGLLRFYGVELILQDRLIRVFKTQKRNPFCVKKTSSCWWVESRGLMLLQFWCWSGDCYRALKLLPDQSDVSVQPNGIVLAGGGYHKGAAHSAQRRLETDGCCMPHAANPPNH